MSLREAVLNEVKGQMYMYSLLKYKGLNTMHLFKANNR